MYFDYLLNSHVAFIHSHSMTEYKSSVYSGFRLGSTNIVNEAAAAVLKSLAPVKMSWSTSSGTVPPKN